MRGVAASLDDDEEQTRDDGDDGGGCHNNPPVFPNHLFSPTRLMNLLGEDKIGRPTQLYPLRPVMFGGRERE
jgi:hypothetical protein